MKIDCVLFGHEGVVTHISTSPKGNSFNEVTVQQNIINHLPFSSKALPAREMDSELYRRGYYRNVPSLLTQYPPIRWDLPLAKRPIQSWQLASFITSQRYLTVHDASLMNGPTSFDPFF